MESVMPWFHSLRESLGAALLLSGRAREAEQIFREDLRENPGSGRSLFGLAKTLAAQGRASDARLVEREFREAWKNADTSLSLDALETVSLKRSSPRKHQQLAGLKVAR